MAKSKPSPFLQILRLARPFYPRILAVSLVIVISSFLRQVFPQIQRLLIDLITTGTIPDFFGFSWDFPRLLVLAVSLLVTGVLFDRLIWSLNDRLDVRFRYRLRELAYRHLLHLSVRFYNQQQSGSLMSKIDRGASQITSAIRNISSNILPNIVSAVIAVFIVASVRWEITVFIVIGFAVYILFRLRRFHLMEKLDRKIQRLWDREYGHFYEAVSSIRLVKSFSAEDYELNKYRRFGRKLISLTDEEDRIQTNFIFANIFLEVWLFAVYAYVFYLGLNHAVSVGTIVLLIQYIQIIRQPFTSLEWTFWEIKRAQVGATDYLAILNNNDLTSEPQTPASPSEILGRITFKNVSFKYPEKGGQQVFDNLNLDIKPGTIVAIVGHSGAGKTTIANLLVRFFDPDQGEILIDGVNIKNIPTADLRRHIGLVMQQSYLFGDTVVKNLRYAKPDATLSQMKQACRIANASEFIEKLPKKYDTVLGERGIRLSGGQQQRLSIARTILKDPPILVLDEATSSLDSHSEALVQDALWKLIEGRTAIIIAHRLSTIKKADQIIVLGKHKVLEQGTHLELLKKGGIYAGLHGIQTGQLEKLKQYELNA